MKDKDAASSFEAKLEQVAMIASQLSRDQASTKTHQARETPRAWGIPREDAHLREMVHEIFDLGHIVGYGACRDIVWVLYLDLDLSRLPPPEKNINEFL